MIRSTAEKEHPLTKQELTTIMNQFKHLAESYQDQSCYNAGYDYGFADALRCVINSYELIYQAVRTEHAIKDVSNHLRDYIEDDAEYEQAIANGIPEIVVERFLDNYDCNVAENDQYESIIEDVLKWEAERK